MSVDTLLKYFPKLSPQQQDQFAQLDPLYREWNEKINVISRKDIDNLYVRHILHSLAISRVISFLPGTSVLDLGTGGGFPVIPLAILYPNVSFTAVDGTGKKIHVVNEVASGIGLKNINAQHKRVEEMKGRQFDFVVTRAVASLAKLIPWSFRLLKTKHQHAIPNGLLALKGGNLKEELKEISKGNYYELYPIFKFFPEELFQDKYVVYVQG
jgi:16S rRNA (guanine527-N7)-methyltransferase